MREDSTGARSRTSRKAATAPDRPGTGPRQQSEMNKIYLCIYEDKEDCLKR